MSAEKKSKRIKPRNLNKPFIIFLFVFLFLFSSIPSVYFYLQFKKAESRLGNPVLGAKDQVKGVITSVGKLIRLPTDENPTVATISNIDNLKKQQPFFANSKNGDKVLIYTKNKKIIIYDPVGNTIVDVGPLTITSATDTAQTTPTPTITPAKKPNLTPTVKK